MKGGGPQQVAALPLGVPPVAVIKPGCRRTPRAVPLSKRKAQKLLTQRTQRASASFAFLLFAPFALRLSAPRPVRRDLDLAVGEVAHVGVERRADERDLLPAPQPLLGVALRLDLRERGGGRHG